MLAVGLGVAEITLFLEKYHGRISVACYSSPNSVTLSGDAALVQELNSELKNANIFARFLKTDGKAYHSHYMNGIAQVFLDKMSKLNLHGSHCHRRSGMISSVTGEPIEEYTIDHAYWAENMVRPVLFNQAMQRMMLDNPSVNLIIELGPHSTLSGPIRQICTEIQRTNVTCLPTLLRNMHDADQLLKLAGELWTRDAAIDLGSVTALESYSLDGSIVERRGLFLADLPPYQWTYDKHLWLESTASREHRC